MVSLASQILYAVEPQIASQALLKSQNLSVLGSKRILVLVCAYNEETFLPKLLLSLVGRDVLVIDDGSTDQTRKIAVIYGAAVLTHEARYGKPASLADGISFALQNSYDIVVEIDADTIPEEGSIEKLVDALKDLDIGGASCRQVPIGLENLAYYIDDLVWATMTKGKELQMSWNKSSHIGAVMIAFKPLLVDSVTGSINDDEELGLSIKTKGYRTVFVSDAVAYFDASSCLGHLFQRRRRMYFGHMKYHESTAPSMQVSISALALMKAMLAKPRRIAWAIPAIVLELSARLMAWSDARKPEMSKRHTRWVTTYAKSNSLVIRNRSSS